MTFGSLPKGAIFEFDHTHMARCSGLAHGPWRKRSARTYGPVADPKVIHKVGTTACEVRLKDTCGAGRLSDQERGA